MAYSDIALLSADNDFTLRSRACVATEGESDPVGWVNSHIWQLAATPGFGDKYGYAVLTGIVRPGNDQSVISDGDILSSVQAIRAEPDVSLPDAP
jgi:hypothetical protein